MSTQSSSDLRNFHQFVGQNVESAGPTPSPEELLDQWRTLHPEPELGEEDLAAIQEAIGDMKNGDAGVPFADFDRDFRARHNLPPSA